MIKKNKPNFTKTPEQNAAIKTQTRYSRNFAYHSSIDRLVTNKHEVNKTAVLLQYVCLCANCINRIKYHFKWSLFKHVAENRVYVDCFALATI